jgi:Subtilase family
VSGIVAAATNNGQGIAGVAAGARLLAVRVLGDDGSGSFDDIGRGIRYATNHGAKVINLSLGALPGVQAFEITGLITDATDAIRYANSKGVVVVAASGNESAPLPRLRCRRGVRDRHRQARGARLVLERPGQAGSPQGGGPGRILGEGLCEALGQAQLVGKKVHQEIVVPHVRAALVAPQHADATKAHGRVRADGALVVDRRIDGEAVVAPFSDEPADGRSQSLAAEPPILVGRRQDEVQAGVAIVGVRLLANR